MPGSFCGLLWVTHTLILPSIGPYRLLTSSSTGKQTYHKHKINTKDRKDYYVTADNKFNNNFKVSSLVGVIIS